MDLIWLIPLQASGVLWQSIFGLLIFIFYSQPISALNFFFFNSSLSFTATLISPCKTYFWIFMLSLTELAIRSRLIGCIIGWEFTLRSAFEMELEFGLVMMFSFRFRLCYNYCRIINLSLTTGEWMF